MKSALILSSILLGSLAVGCSGTTAGAEPPGGAATGAAPATTATAETETRVAPVAPQAKSMRVRMAADALSTVPLRDDQRAQIEQLASDADNRYAASGAAHAAILTELASEVESGKVDRASLQPKLDAAADALNAERPAEQAAIVKLHDLLTSDQRAAFVNAIESRGKAKHDEEAHESRLDKWAEALQLTDAQKAQIAGALADGARPHRHEAGHHPDHPGRHHGGFLESFRGDTVDLPPAEDAHEQTNAMADHALGVIEKVLPILTPEQRTLAAQKLRDKAAKAQTGDTDSLF
jgi:hypothetical protein